MGDKETRGQGGGETRGQGGSDLSFSPCLYSSPSALIEACDRDDFISGGINLDRVAQRATEAFKADRHLVAVRQLNACAEAEGVGAEEMDVQIAGPAAPLEFEVP